MNNPFSTLTKKEWLLWLCSLFIVLVSNILAANFDPLTLIIRYHLLPVPLLG